MAERETFDALTIDDDGATVFMAATPQDDLPGFTGYLVPFYTLSDRGSYFVPGSLKKTAKEQLKRAPHLWHHNSWEDEIPIGRHTEAFEDDKGFRISVAVNEGVGRGADVMSALRFGTPMGLSIGFDGLRDRSGTDDDDVKLDRRTAPDFLKDTPINELRAITEARWWESSSVVFGAIATAKPDQIRSRNQASPDAIPTLMAAIQAGTLTPEQIALAEQFVNAWNMRAAAGTDHGTRDQGDDRRNEYVKAMALYAHIRELEMSL